MHTFPRWLLMHRMKLSHLVLLLSAGALTLAAGRFFF